MSDEREFDDLPQENRGGARAGAGRKKKNPRDLHKAAAENAFGVVERFLCGRFGDDWTARGDEKKAITESLAAILQRWEIEGFDNPYLHLTLATGFYAFGKKGRATGEGIGEWFATLRAKWKKAAPKKPAKAETKK